METYLFTDDDLLKVVSNAKDNMSKLSLPLYISNKEVNQGSVVSVAIIESVLMLLNSKNLLTKQVKIDYNDVSCNFEINEE
jgi:hypothetical protein